MMVEKLENIKISIILPCYNVENYISVCLDSIYAQDIPENEYEVICVNDCSPDKTKAIIIEYQNIHKNLRLIEHEKNKRQGGARNTGLNIARGEYIWFVDPDDYIKENIFSKLVSICKENNLDILIFNYYLVNNNKIRNVNNYKCSKVTSGIEYLKSIGENFLDNYFISVWSFFVNKDFYDTNNLFFIENTVYEDLEFSLKCMLYAKNVKSTSDYYYYYRVNLKSTTNTLKFYTKADTLFQTCFTIGYGLTILSECSRKMDEDISKKISEGAKWRINKFTKPLIKSSIKEKIAFFKYISSRNSLITKIAPQLNTINKRIIKYPFITKHILILIHPLILTYLNIIKPFILIIITLSGLHRISIKNN